MADVFISYARQDREKVEKLAAALEVSGYSVWWDRQIVAGAEFSKDIERELNSAKVVVVAWSKQANESRWVRDEAVAAAEQGKLIPISTDGTPAPMGFKQFQVIDFAAWRGDTASPAFEDLSRAVKARVTGAAPEATAHRAGKRLTLSDPRVWGGALAALVLIVAAVALWLRMPAKAPAAPGAPAAVSASTPSASNSAEQTRAASIAVLPFADLSPAKDQEYFSDGMAEEILNVLAKVKGLDVASRTSSFQFKGQELGIPEIAKKLSVRHVVEGSVRKAGATIRITAQLIDTETDRHLWSETFDRPLTTENIFTIQDEIAQAIVKALNQTMGTGAAAQVTVVPATDNLTAYDLFLQARPLFLARRDLDKAEELLARSVEQDPNYANAWEMRAAMQPLMVEYGYSFAAPTEVERRTVEFANRALAINPQSALAIAVLGKWRMTDAQLRRKPGDYEAIIAGFERALAIDPRNASALNWRGLVYADVGNLQVALASFDRCLELEAYYTPCMSNQVEVLGSLGRDKEALAAYRKALDKGFVSFYFAFHLLARTGQEYAFKAATGSPSLLLGWRRHDELYQAHRHPERTYPELIADIRRFNEAKTKPMTDADLAEILGPIGFYEITPTPAVFWDAAFAGYRRSEQFKSTVKNFGVYDYWRKHGFPPQCKPVGKDDFECN